MVSPIDFNQEPKEEFEEVKAVDDMFDLIDSKT